MSQLTGRYIIVGHLTAAHSYCYVYKALDVFRGRNCVIKLTGDKRSLPAIESFCSSLDRAARQSSNIAPIYRVGALSSGHVFFILPYLNGRTLDQHLATADATLDDRIDLILLVSDAVASAHEFGIIHGDINPGNIFVEDSGRVTVTDFGLAHVGRRSSMNQASGSYVAPELFVGAGPSLASDVFSLGAITYELLTGKLPVECFEFEEARPVYALNPSVSERVTAVVQRALAIEPRRRYGSAREFSNSLSEAKRSSRFYGGDGQPAIDDEPEVDDVQILQNISGALAELALLDVDQDDFNSFGSDSTETSQVRKYLRECVQSRSCTVEPRSLKHLLRGSFASVVTTIVGFFTTIRHRWGSPISRRQQREMEDVINNIYLGLSSSMVHSTPELSDYASAAEVQRHLQLSLRSFASRGHFSGKSRIVRDIYLAARARLDSARRYLLRGVGIIRNRHFWWHRARRAWVATRKLAITRCWYNAIKVELRELAGQSASYGANPEREKEWRSAMEWLSHRTAELLYELERDLTVDPSINRLWVVAKDYCPAKGKGRRDLIEHLELALREAEPNSFIAEALRLLWVTLEKPLFKEHEIIEELRDRVLEIMARQDAESKWLCQVIAFSWALFHGVDRELHWQDSVSALLKVAKTTADEDHWLYPNLDHWTNGVCRDWESQWRDDLWLMSEGCMEPEKRWILKWLLGRVQELVDAKVKASGDDHGAMV